jgi:hypothetical protein
MTACLADFRHVIDIPFLSSSLNEIFFHCVKLRPLIFCERVSVLRLTGSCGDFHTSVYSSHAILFQFLTCCIHVREPRIILMRVRVSLNVCVGCFVSHITFFDLDEIWYERSALKLVSGIL